MAEDLRLALVPAAVAGILLFIAGFVPFRRWSAAFAIPWPAMNDDGQGIVVIEDTQCAFQGYEQELIVGLRVRRFPELIATVILAAASLYATLFVTISLGPVLPEAGFFGIEFIALVGWVVLMANLRWFNEQRILGRSYATVAPILGRDPGFFRRGISYQFLDQNRERRGGQGPLWGRGKDSAVIVFYNPKAPDENTSHGAFIFHRFVVGLIPRRNELRVNST